MSDILAFSKNSNLSFNDRVNRIKTEFQRVPGQSLSPDQLHNKALQEARRVVSQPVGNPYQASPFQSSYQTTMMLNFLAQTMSAMTQTGQGFSNFMGGGYPQPQSYQNQNYYAPVSNYAPQKTFHTPPPVANRPAPVAPAPAPKPPAKKGGYA